jgi:hypothetical protein
VLTWQHRITRVRERCSDLFGHEGWRWRVVRTSNAYVFHDPQTRLTGVPASECKNPPGTLNQGILQSVMAPAHDPNSPLERVLARFGAALAAKNGIEQRAAGQPGVSEPNTGANMTSESQPAVGSVVRPQKATPARSCLHIHIANSYRIV